MERRQDRNIFCWNWDWYEVWREENYPVSSLLASKRLVWGFYRSFSKSSNDVSGVNLNLLPRGAFNLDFWNFMVSYDLFLAVTIPTRIMDYSATLIDNVFVSSKYPRKAFSNIVVNPKSNHFPVVFSINLQVSCQKK